MTKAFKWSVRSKKEMAEVHPDLRKLCDKALQYTDVDFVVTDGRRTTEEQRQHFRNGASQTLKSRHLHGMAVDVAALVNGKITWSPVYYKAISIAFKQAAVVMGIPIKWGGDWKTFKDFAHFELDKKEYPDK